MTHTANGWDRMRPHRPRGLYAEVHNQTGNHDEAAEKRVHGRRPKAEGHHGRAQQGRRSGPGWGEEDGLREGRPEATQEWFKRRVELLWPACRQHHDASPAYLVLEYVTASGEISERLEVPLACALTALTQITLSGIWEGEPIRAQDSSGGRWACRGVRAGNGRSRIPLSDPGPQAGEGPARDGRGRGVAPGSGAQALADQTVRDWRAAPGHAPDAALGEGV